MLVVWVVVGALTIAYAGKLQDATTNSQTAFLPRTAESTRLVDAQKVFDSSNDLSLSIVYKRNGFLTVDDRQRIEDTRSALLTRFNQTALDVPIVPSGDRRASLINISIHNVIGDENQIAMVDLVREMAGGSARGLTVLVTGPGAFIADAEKVYEGIDFTLIAITAVIVTILLLITYRSPLLWILPLVAIMLGNGLASWFIYQLAINDVVTLDGQSAGILPVLVFGIGTDYALLLISRYRDQLRVTADHHEAMAVAVRKAAPTIVASGVTVMLGLLCLYLSELNSNRALAPVGALSVAFTLVASLTLLPALLLAAGRRIFWPLIPNVGSESRPLPLWKAIGDRIALRPSRYAASTLVALLVCAIPVVMVDTGLRQVDLFTGSPDSVKGQDLIAESFPGGAAEPVIVMTNTRQAKDVREQISQVKAVANAVEIDRTEPDANADCAPDPNDISKCLDLNGKTEYAVTLSTTPDSTEERQAIKELRAKVHTVDHADALVGGASAQNMDLAHSAQRDRNVVLPLVLIAVFLVLVALLRALVAAAILIGSVVVSYFAALGISVLVFRYLFGFPAEDPGLLLLAFVFLVALGIDYGMFLAARVRERVGDVGTVDATREAMVETGGVITSAGAVLAATFAVLVTLPIVAVTQLGFMVAIGVLIDTFIVRTLLVPALFMYLGDTTWSWRPTRTWRPAKPIKR